jgi:predicted lactoylglutathione lyase
MSTKIFINLPVKDLATSRRFFAELGFAFNQDFADENMECVIISDGIYVMLWRPTSRRSPRRKSRTPPRPPK